MNCFNTLRTKARIQKSINEQKTVISKACINLISDKLFFHLKINFKNVTYVHGMVPGKNLASRAPELVPISRTNNSNICQKYLVSSR